MKIDRFQEGGVLIPVLLFSSMITLGVIVLLQTQIIQKKSVADFKLFLENRRQSQRQDRFFQTLSLEKILSDNSIKLIQKIPSNHHYQNSNFHYYFQFNQDKVIYKVSASENNGLGSDSKHVVVLNSNPEFNYSDSIVRVIQARDNDQSILYFYDSKHDRVLFKASFFQQPYFQLVGNPIECVYIHDTVGLYKLDLTAQSHPIEMNLLQPIDPTFNPLPIPPIVTRDERGDGRLITLLGQNNISFVFHEPVETKHPCLDLFDHFYFPGK